MAVGTARRLERPTWLNGRTALGLLLFVAALLMGQGVLSRGAASSSVWVATRDIGAATRLDGAALVPVLVDLPPEQASLYMPSTEPLDGMYLTRAISAGEMVPAAAVSSRPATASGGRSMTIPVAPEHAAGGMVAPGDRIDVVATFDAGRSGSESHVLLEGVEVTDVLTSGGLVAGDETVAGVTVSLPAADVARVAFAIRNAEIDIVLSDGRPAGIAGSAFTRGDL